MSSTTPANYRPIALLLLFPPVLRQRVPLRSQFQQRGPLAFVNGVCSELTHRDRIMATDQARRDKTIEKAILRVPRAQAFPHSLGHEPT